MNRIKRFYTTKPLFAILAIAFIARLVAVFFAQGYAFHDDHFLVIDAAQSWLGNQNWNTWMPKTQRLLEPGLIPVPEGHSLLYPGIHYILLGIMEFFGIYDPKIKMILVRLVHALFSLWAVAVGYKITKHYTSTEHAKKVGLFLALVWFMPFMSVRNLVEIACIPFLMYGTWLLIQSEDKASKTGMYLFAGLMLGIAFSLRFQTLVYVGGAGLVLLFRQQWKPALVFGVGVISAIILVQGGIDYFIWGKPFAELIEYVKYNMLHRFDYGTNNYYMYFTLLLGMIIPPLGIYMFIGWFKLIKKIPLLFWPSFLFFAFHTYFPNKQERFILPIITIFMVAGFIGWIKIQESSRVLQKGAKWIKGSMIFFWILNTALLIVISTTYSKRSRCEAMVFLGKQADAKYILVDESIKKSVTQMPTFYAGKDLVFYNLPNPAAFEAMEADSASQKLLHMQLIESPLAITANNWPEPDFALIINEKNREERYNHLKSFYPQMQQVAIIEPSYIDRLMRMVTPSNNNQRIYIYKLNNKHN